MKCPNCETENRSTARFCEQCGNHLPEAPAVSAAGEAALICEKCGFQNKLGSRFCEQCAAPLEMVQPETKPDKDETLPPASRVKPQARPIIRPVRVCPQCGSHNAPELRFCEQCAAPLIPAGVAAPPPPRPSRWQPWVLPAVVAGLIVIIALFVAAGLLYFFNSHRLQPEEAVRAADRIVEQYYPEYVGAQQTVNDWEFEGVSTGYVVSYGFETDEKNGLPFPRALNIYFDPETETIMIEQMN